MTEQESAKHLRHLVSADQMYVSPFSPAIGKLPYYQVYIVSNEDYGMTEQESRSVMSYAYLKEIFMTISDLLSQYGEKYIQALFTTWQLTALSFSGAVIIGIIITVMRVCPIKPLRIFGDFYVQIFRNIPGAALLIVLVYALPNLNIILSYNQCVLTATTMIPAAFCSEYLMSGIEAIGIGQIEAARSLGMTFGIMMRKVVIPQAVRFSVLPMTNLLIATMLTTSLASQVPLNPKDLTGLVSYINTRDVGGVTSFMISSAMYCGTAVIIGQIGSFIDKKVRIIR